MKIVKIVLAVLSVGLSFALLAQIDDEKIRETAKITGDSIEEVQRYSRKCESGGTTSMAECSAYFLEAADKELNDLYQRLRKKHGRGTVADQSLVKAQRAWVTFSSATCAYESLGYRGGGFEGVLINGCREKLTKQRSLELGAYLSCSSNDCP